MPLAIISFIFNRMKLFFALLSTILLLGSLPCHAQGNLQFNEVKFIEVHASNRTYNTGGTNYVYLLDSVIVVVPAGKVWKVENVAVNGIINSAPGAIPHKIPTRAIWGSASSVAAMINNNMVVQSNNTISEIDRIETPIWLNPGTYSFKVLSLGSNFLSNVGQTIGASGFFSVIEFNVVP